MKPKLLIAVFLFLTTVSVYWFTANPLPSGYADSDELVTAGYLFSVAHPPGYGLNILLIGIFQRLLFFLTPAYSSNLLAGILHSLTLVFIFLSATKLVDYQLKSTSKTYKYIILALGTLVTGFSGLYWLYSSVIEVMSLGNLFTALILYQAISWYCSPQKKWFKLILISLTLGLGIGHLQSLIFLAPPLLYLLITTIPTSNRLKSIKSISIALFITLIGFLLSSAIILPLNSRSQTYSWDFQNDLPGWWHMVTRQDYKGTLVDTGVTVDNPYVNSISLNFIKNIPHYLITIWNHYAGLPFLLSFLGVFYLWKLPKKTIFIYIITSYLLAGLLFGSYATLTDFNPKLLQYRLLVGTAERQYLLGFTFLGILISFGCLQLLIISKYLFSSPKLANKISLFSLLTIITSLILTNYPLANQRSNQFLYHYADTILTHAKPDSLIICTSDFACFSLYYQSIVEHKRPDVAVIPLNNRGRRNYLINHQQKYIDFIYPENPSYVSYVIAYNLKRRPTYMTFGENFYINYIGLDGNPFYIDVDNYLSEISTHPNTQVTENKPKLINSIINYPIDNRDLHLLGFHDYLASYFQLQALYQTKYQHIQPAADALDVALYLNPQDERVIDWRLKLNHISLTIAYDLNNSTSSAQYLELAQDYLVKNQPAIAESLARKSFYLNPPNLTALKFLQNIYHQYHYPLFDTWTQAHIQYIESHN